MNEHIDFERTVAGHIADEGVSPPSDAFYDELFSRAADKGPRPEWLALIKEPPMRTNSHLAVGSPTFRVAAILAATFLLAVALAGIGIAGQRLLAADDAIVVAADGSGDYTTISEAVAAAVDGDMIMVRPGEYTDPVYVDKDISVIGDGPRDEIVIGGHDMSATIADSDCESEFPCMLLLDQSDASLSNVTIRGAFAGVGVVGGAPTIEGVLFDQNMERTSDGAPFSGVVLSIGEDSAAQIIDNEFMGDSDLTIQDGANPLVEGNTLDGWGINAAWPGDDAILRGNEINGSRASGISIHHASTLLIEDNVIRDVTRDGITADFNGARGFDAVVRGNTISGNAGSGIAMGSGANPTIEGNTLADNNFGIFLQVGDAIVRDNDVNGGAIGIVVAGGGAQQITGNTIETTGRGISITNGSAATLSGNTVCGEEESIFVDDRSEPTIDDTNETCDGPDAA